ADPHPPPGGRRACVRLSPCTACSPRPKPLSTWAWPRRPCAGGAGGVGSAGLRSATPPASPSTTCAPSWRPTNAPPPHHRPVLPRHPPRLGPLVSRMAGRRAKAPARYGHCRPWGSPAASPRADPRRRRDPGRRPGRDRPGRRARAVLAPAWACPPEPGHPEARDRAVGRVLGPAGGERLHGGPAGAIRALAGPEGPQRRLPAPRARRGEGGAEPRLEAGRGAAGALHRPAPDGRALPRDGHPRAARRPAERADARSPADVLPDPPGHGLPRRCRPGPAALPDRPPAPAGEAQPARPAPD